MSKQARSARGEIIDFDVLAIKQQLATKPVPVGVDQRRKFIDEKDGIKTKTAAILPTVASLPSAFAMAVEAASESAAASSAADDVSAETEVITENISVTATAKAE